MKKQLHMVWLKGNGDCSGYFVPKGYHLRTYQEGDKEGYIQLMEKAGFEEWSDSYEEARKLRLPKGLFFIIHDDTDKIVATTVANHGMNEFHPGCGEIGWVAADPDHKGKGLGGVVCAAAACRLLDIGYEELYLQTDDFRLPAIKTYLKMGWLPFIFHDDMERRWQKVLKKLNIEVRTVSYV